MQDSTSFRLSDVEFIHGMVLAGWFIGLFLGFLA